MFQTRFEEERNPSKKNPFKKRLIVSNIVWTIVCFVLIFFNVFVIQEYANLRHEFQQVNDLLEMEHFIVSELKKNCGNN